MLLWVPSLVPLTPLLALPFFAKLPGLRNTALDKCYNFVYINSVCMVRWADQHLMRGCLDERSQQLLRYLGRTKHPFGLIFYTSVMSISAAIFIPSIWPYLEAWERFAVPFVLFLPYLFTYLCNSCPSDAPHIITARSHAVHMKQYPYDCKLFHPDTVCTTCQRARPARSKHCSVCNVCVARADHHCIWLNNCIGAGNYRWFLLLLISLIGMMFYATYFSLVTAVRQVDWLRMDLYNHINRPSNSLRTIVAYWNAFIAGGILRSGIGVFALTASVMPAGLLMYHIQLIYKGMTTYECNKWEIWRQEIADGCVYLTTLLDISDSSIEGPNSKRSLTGSRQFLVLTDDGQVPRQLAPGIVKLVGEKPEWRHCQSFDEVRNEYDLGLWQNLIDRVVN